MKKEKIFFELPKMLAFVEECAHSLNIVFNYAGKEYSECSEETYAQLAAKVKELDSLTTETLTVILKIIESNEHSLEPYQWEDLHMDLSENYSERKRLLSAFPHDDTCVESDIESEKNLTDDSES